MASEAEKAVVYAYLRGQLDVAHEAIVNIWNVLQGIDGGIADGEDFDIAMDNALRCLPPEKRIPEMGDLDAPRKAKWTGAYTQEMTEEFTRQQFEGESGFDDVLG